MNVSNIFKKAIKFGTFHSRENFFSFILKFLFYIIPAIILGNYTDNNIKMLRENKVLGDNTFFYIIMQTLIIIITFYLIFLFLPNFESEFQLTLSGSYFIVLYFGIQTNYINMIKMSIN